GPATRTGVLARMSAAAGGDWHADATGPVDTASATVAYPRSTNPSGLVWLVRPACTNPHPETVAQVTTKTAANLNRSTGEGYRRAAGRVSEAIAGARGTLMACPRCAIWSRSTRPS